MRNLLSFGIALAAIVSAGPLMAQSCCSGGAAAPNFSGSAVQPIQSYARANYSAPATYSPSGISATSYAPTAYRAPAVYPQRLQAAPHAYASPRMTSTYTAPTNNTYSSGPGGSFGSTVSAPIYSYAAPPMISTSAKSRGGCGCGCGTTGSCGCGH